MIQNKYKKRENFSRNHSCVQLQEEIEIQDVSIQIQEEDRTLVGTTAAFNCKKKLEIQDVSKQIQKEERTLVNTTAAFNCKKKYSF